MWATLIGMIPGVGNFLTKALPFIARDKVAVESNIHDEQKAVLDEAKAEAAAQGTMLHRTWFDSLVDGINRLVRPTFTFGIIALVVYCIQDPIDFSAAMTAMTLVPTWLAAIIATVVGFWFGGRLLTDINFSAAPSIERVKQVTAQIAEIKSMHEQTQAQISAITPFPSAPPTIDGRTIPTAKPEDDKRFSTEMADTTKPLSNEAILEWNRRRQTAR